MKFLVSSILLIGILTVSGFCQEILPSGVLKETYSTRQQGSADITFYLRYPSSGSENVKGVKAICPPGGRGLAVHLADKSRHYGYLLDLADKYQLATVAFGPPG